MLTGLPDELPDEDPELLERVVTGRPVEPDPAEDPPRALVRVVTGAPAAGAPTECEPLTRVATVPVPPPADPAAGDLLAPVRSDPAAWELAAPPREPLAPRDPAAPAADSCLTMWIVRRITTVRVSTAGFRAATVTAVFDGGRRANAASTAATSAVATAAVRVCLLRMPEPPVRGTATTMERAR